jgi:diguanylate cyclase (GGDEF)-like protein
LKQSSVNNDILLEIINIQTEVVQQGIDLSNIMDLVTQRAQLISNADGACVELVENMELVYSATSGIAKKFLGLRLDKESSLSGACIKAGAPLISNNIENDDRVNKNACRQIGLNSMIVVPLIYRDDVVGVIKVLSSKANFFNNDHIKILELMSGLIAAAMSNAMTNGESELFYKATHDSLTGISNRAIFYDRLRQKLAQSLRNKDKFGIVTLDLDGLKEINDNFGHRAGDAAIKEVALRVSNNLRETDTFSRLGGDEFGIIVASAMNHDDLALLTHRLDEQVKQPFAFEGQEINLRASIGYALFNEDGIEIDVLIEKADKMMYEVKRKRKGIENVR